MQWREDLAAKEQERREQIMALRPAADVLLEEITDEIRNSVHRYHALFSNPVDRVTQENGTIYREDRDASVTLTIDLHRLVYMCRFSHDPNKNKDFRMFQTNLAIWNLKREPSKISANTS